MRRLWGSLHLRLLLLSAALIIGALALFGWQLSHMFEQHVERRVFQELNNHLTQILALLKRDAKGRIVLSRPLNDPRFSRPYSGLYWQVNDEKGPVARSRSLWDAALSLHIDMARNGPVHEYTLKGPEGEPLYAVIRPVWLDLGEGERRYLVAVAQDHAEIATAVGEFRKDLFFGIAMLFGVLVFALGLQVWLGLKPLKAIRREVMAVRAGQRDMLSERHAVTELRPLIEEINALLTSQRQDMERARQRASDLAHGLKTPLSILAAQARRLQGKGVMEEAREIHAQVKALRQHVERELARAKIHGLRRGLRPQTDAGKQIRALMQALSGMRADDPIRWHIDVPEGFKVPMERGDFLELFGNLLENACKWARKQVSVLATWEGDHEDVAVIRIEDDGPGIPEEKYADVFKRGKRLDESVQGTGLGMAIVRDVIDSYGYDLSLYRAPLGGLGVRITFAERPVDDTRVMEREKNS